MNPTTAQAWVLAARPQTLTISVAPVLLGAALASEVGPLSIPVLIAAMLGAICIQIGTNLFNDYADFNKGADGADRLGPLRACANGWLPPRQVLIAVGVTFAIAIAAGIYLAAVAGWPVVIIGLASLVCGLAYTGGPWPLAYVGIADLFVFVFFGLVAVGGTYFVLAGGLSLAAILGGAVPRQCSQSITCATAPGTGSQGNVHWLCVMAARLHAASTHSSLPVLRCSLCWWPYSYPGRESAGWRRWHWRPGWYNSSVRRSNSMGGT